MLLIFVNFLGAFGGSPNNLNNNLTNILGSSINPYALLLNGLVNTNVSQLFSSSGSNSPNSSQSNLNNSFLSNLNTLYLNSLNSSVGLNNPNSSNLLTGLNSMNKNLNSSNALNSSGNLLNNFISPGASSTSLAACTSSEIDSYAKNVFSTDYANYSATIAYLCALDKAANQAASFILNNAINLQ